MYTQYFNLKEKPFSISPDPRFLYMSELHREALAHLLYGVSCDGCFILLTGDVGTGKTTVCRCLLEQLPERTRVACILNPRLNVEEMLATICDELEIPGETGKQTVKEYVDRLNHFLLENHAQGFNTALIIDEAQNLSLELLEQLRLLTNLETNKKKLLKIILLGQPELKQLLNEPSLTQLSQRITSRYHLMPLGAEDVAIYVRHRLAVAGCKTDLFPRSILKNLYSYTDGIPRLINVICDRALLGAYVENKAKVNQSILYQAASEVLPDDGRFVSQKAPRQMVLNILFFIIGAVLAIIISYPWLHHDDADQPPVHMPETAIQKPAPQSLNQVAAPDIKDADETIQTSVVPDMVKQEEKKPEVNKTTINITPVEVI